MSGRAVAAGWGALGAAAGAPPVRFTDSSTVKFSSRSLAASRLAVSASLNAPTCTQYGPLGAVAGLGVVAGVAARLGAGVALAATVGLASSFVGDVAGAGFAVSTLATVSGLAAGAGVAGSGVAAGLERAVSVSAAAAFVFRSGRGEDGPRRDFLVQLVIFGGVVVLAHSNLGVARLTVVMRVIVA